MPSVRHADYLCSLHELLREDNRAIVRAESAASKAADDPFALRPEPGKETVRKVGGQAAR